MTKKLAAAFSIIGALALGGGALAAGSLMKKPAVADEEYVQKPAEGLITELKAGRYYLEGGTEDEYMEVYSDGTLQFFGLDYLKLVCDLNADHVASMSEEEFEVYAAGEQDQVDFWNNRHYYWCNNLVKAIHLDDELPEPGQLASRSGHGLGYTDENTILWDDDRIYKFAE